MKTVSLLLLLIFLQTTLTAIMIENQAAAPIRVTVSTCYAIDGHLVNKEIFTQEIGARTTIEAGTLLRQLSIVAVSDRSWKGLFFVTSHFVSPVSSRTPAAGHALPHKAVVLTSCKVFSYQPERLLKISAAMLRHKNVMIAFNASGALADLGFEGSLKTHARARAYGTPCAFYPAQKIVIRVMDAVRLTPTGRRRAPLSTPLAFLHITAEERHAEELTLLAGRSARPAQPLPPAVDHNVASSPTQLAPVAEEFNEEGNPIAPRPLPATPSVATLARPSPERPGSFSITDSTGTPGGDGTTSVFMIGDFGDLGAADESVIFSPLDDNDNPTPSPDEGSAAIPVRRAPSLPGLLRRITTLPAEGMTVPPLQRLQAPKLD